MRRFLVYFPLMFLSLFVCAEDNADTLSATRLDEVVVQSIKESGELRTLASSGYAIDSKQLENNHFTSLKNASNMVPNMFIPDYGSRMTSAIYIRGVGSRINTPAVGLYVDNIPYADKSAFDFNFFDIERVDVLRGPQGTLYGSNTMGGLVRIFSKNPFHYEGTDVRLSYATKDNHRTASVNHYHRFSNMFALSAGGYYEGGDGFFRNSFLNKKVDGIEAGGGRIRAMYQPTERLLFDLNVNFDYSDEGVYPYYYTGVLSGEEQYGNLIGQITNNRENSYRRTLANAGLNIEYKGEGWKMNAVTGYQYLNDRMFMDQDFLKDDIYTLEQRQRINTINEEIIFKSNGEKRWEWLAGMNVMYQSLHTTGPVVFYEDGLRWLEGNINTVMPAMDKIPMLMGMGFQNMSINFRGEDLLMDGKYDTPKFTAALFHQSTFHFTDHLSASLGVRFDNEYHKINYHSPADILYGFRMPNAKSAKMGVDLQQLESHILYDGNMHNNNFKVLPKFALTYTFDNKSNIYASVAEGHRSGGYNLQMFSDLLQDAMRADMMSGVQQGVGSFMEELVKKTPGMPAQINDPSKPGTMISLPDYVKGMMAANMPAFETPSTNQIAYKPEYAWNFEIGGHFNIGEDMTDYGMKGTKIQLDASIFYSRIYDQQVARFAPSGFGRMMVNAGKSKSLGGELSVRWTPTRNWHFQGDYGFTRAKFVKYDTSADTKGYDYSDNYVPFVPMHTMHADAAYTWFLRSCKLTAGIGCHGAGRIYWTESNQAYQNFYTVLDARAVLELSNISFTLWGKNLNACKYNTFYFESANRGFEQHSKPLQIGLDVHLHF